MNGRLWLYIGSKDGWRDVGAAGCLALDDVCNMNLPVKVLGRDMLAFPDHIALPPTERECFDYGQRLAEGMFARHPRRLWGRMGPNEQHPKDGPTARRWGAFEGGAAQTTWRCMETYVGLNCSYGELEADLFCDWLQAFVLWAKPGNSPWLVGYHGYTDGKTDAYWLERRPWTLWKPYLERRGLRLPRIMMTEAGYDKGPTDPPYRNGYRANLSSEDYADYLRGLPSLVPECEAFCIYLSGTVDPDKWRTFDYSGDTVVESAIRETNQKGATPMPEAWDRATVWASYKRRLSETPAFQKMRAQHPELGDAISSEYDRGDYRLQDYAGGIIWARIGDWGNCYIAKAESDLPLR